MSGFVIGQNNFNPQGSFYCYDPQNTIIWTGKNSKSDVFVGYIGQLKEKPLKKFKETLKAQDRFKNFEAFQKKDYEMITHEVKAKWSRRIEFNGDV
jgi:Txe/YoeB family toxin of Txe-Axe toxin-antitoxin module